MPVAIPREWSTLPVWIRGAILIVLILVVAPIVALLNRCLAELAQRRGRSDLVVSLALIFADVAVGATYVTTKFAELAVHSIQLQEQARRDVEDAIVKKYGSTENFKAWLRKSGPAQ